MTMWLNYTDKEVETFHPLCEIILNRALQLANLQTLYKIEHHRTVGSLEMDFVISNIETSKILCVIEVKRTIEAVLSTRYQLQAMGYVQELRPNEKEKEYYILTNLECVGFFKYSTNRPNVSDQLLSPGVNTIARFGNLSREDFIKMLSTYFADILIRIINDDNDYFKSFRHFVDEVSEANDNIISDTKVWHSKFAAISYEYIRGALNSVGRYEMVDIRRLNNDIGRICQEALRVNFNAIYGLNSDEYDLLPSIPSETLTELYELGKTYLDADAISDILFNFIAKNSPYPGAVPTDIELAKALAVVSSAFLPVLKETERVFDPAAGSGNLLSVIPTIYPAIKPNQISANDINIYLLQLLSLRLGLKFPRIVNSSNHPDITAYNIADIPETSFEQVKLIVLNPPYLSHTANASNDYKSGIIRRIRQLKGEDATFYSQTTPLESAFIELVTLLADKGCVIACIVPLTHLYGMGKSDILFRKMLLDRFGLRCICRYPQENIFKNVSQNTCILLGIIDTEPTEIVYINSLDKVDNIDYDSLKTAIIDQSFSHQDGIEKQCFTRPELVDTINSGWKILDSIASKVNDFLIANLGTHDYFGLLRNSTDLQDNFRGKVGNSGGSDLLFPKEGSDFYNSVYNLIQGHLRIGVRTITTLDTPYLTSSHTHFLDVSDMNECDIETVADIFKHRFEPRRGRQIRFPKTKEDYVNLLKSEARYGVPTGSILLARDCRRYGRAYFVETKTFASTNVLVFNLSDTIKGKFYHSWFCSVFYQLNCELASKNHAGTRKMDASEFASTLVPRYDDFSESDILEITNCRVESFVELSNPTIREIDIIWAKLISPENWRELLNEAVRYLGLLATDRES